MDYIYSDIKRQFDSIKGMLGSWHKIEVPDHVNLNELDKWLEESISERYYRDRLSIVNSSKILWLENTNDLKNFNEYWKILKQVPTAKLILS